MANGKEEGSGSPHPWAQWIALAGVLVFVASIVVLYVERNSDETEWQRLLVIWASVNTVGLAAIGFFLGREVTIKRAEQAEHAAAVQGEKAKVAGEEAAAAREGMQTERAKREEIARTAGRYLEERGIGGLLLGNEEARTSASDLEIRLAELIAEA